MNCLQCNTEFQPTHHAQKICSAECRKKRGLEKCNAYRKTPQYKAYCQRPEVKAGFAKAAKKYAEKIKPKVYKNCKLCNKNFLVTHRARIHCSAECRITSMKIAQNLRNFSMLSRVCIICEKITKHSATCSDECNRRLREIHNKNLPDIPKNYTNFSYCSTCKLWCDFTLVKCEYCHKILRRHPRKKTLKRKYQNAM